MKFKYYTIYKTTNKKTLHFYIGSHKTNNLKDSYMGSGTLIKNKLKEYGKENFSKEVLYIFDNPEDMSIKEREIVNEAFIKNKNNYNIRLGGGSKYDRRLPDVIDLDNKILRLIKTKTVDEIIEILEIKKHRIRNCLIKHNLDLSDIHTKPLFSKSDYKFIKESYTEMRSSSLAKYLNIKKCIVDIIISRIDSGFVYSSIYKEDLKDLYIRKGLSLKEIASAYNFSQANLTSYMKKYNIYELKERYEIIKKRADTQNRIDLFLAESDEKNTRKKLKKFNLTMNDLLKHKINLKK